MAIQIAYGGKKIVKKVLYSPTVQDIKIVENLRVRRVKKSESNFSKELVAKPWGCEYLCGRNKFLEVWELYIKAGASTSLHCHPEKDTLNLILEGTAILETLGGKCESLRAGDFSILKAGVVHKTYNNGKGVIRILEIESPPNKYNLIRVKDFYGREAMGYVQLQTEKKRNIRKRTCLNRTSGNRKQWFIKSFMASGNNKLGMQELTCHSMNFESDKDDMLEKLRSLSIKNMLITTGSLAIMKKGGEPKKVLPGDCVLDLPLWQFNWSTQKVTALLW